MKATLHTSYFLAASLFALPIAASAVETFHVGDRVLASPSSLQDPKYWRPCTVTEVHEFVPKRAYSLRCDALASGGSSSSFLVNQDWVRPLASDRTGPARPAVPGVNAGATAASMPSAPGAAAGVVCPVPGDDGAEPGRSMKSAIRGGFEHDAAPGADGKVTVTFDAFSIGQPHAYTVYQDPSEANGKRVYPVRARFTACTDYHTRIVLDTRERMFACYQDTAGQWACDIQAAANTNVKDVSRSIEKHAR